MATERSDAYITKQNTEASSDPFVNSPHVSPAEEGRTPALDSVVNHQDKESLDEADSDSEDDDDEEESTDTSSPHDDCKHEQPLTDQHLDTRSNQHSSTRERAGDNGAPAAGFCIRGTADSIQLPHPGALPRDVFAHDWDDHPWRQSNDSSKLSRMVRHDNPYEFLIYTNASLSYSQACKYPRAGCAILTTGGRDEHTSSRCKGFLLEKKGPSGKSWEGTDLPYSQKRADLRAVVAALECQTWGSEGWKKVTIATKSSYVYNGMTRFVGKWKLDEWLAKSWQGPPSKVQNVDLWARALDLVNEQAYHGCKMQFWLLSRDQGMRIDDYTRWLARESDLTVPGKYKPLGNVDLTFMGGGTAIGLAAHA